MESTNNQTPARSSEEQLKAKYGGKLYRVGKFRAAGRKPTFFGDGQLYFGNPSRQHHGQRAAVRRRTC